MTELSVLERVRAAVAEAGYDPRLILPARTAWGAYNYGLSLPYVVVWRARETVGVGEPRCFRCQNAEAQAIRALPRRGAFIDSDAPRPTLADGCLADRRFVEDCGRDRSEP